MRNSKKIYSVSLATVILMSFLIFLASMVSTATAQSATSTINETKIITNGSASFPDIYGDRIVYNTWCNETKHSDVYLYDLSTKKETKIPTSGSVGSPKIFGDRIVYSSMNMSNGRSDIYMYNLSTSKESQITTSGISSFPKIYDDKIVYLNSLGSRGDIYLYDLSTKKETPIIVNRYPGIPAIYGDRIVFHEWSSRLLEHADIIMYNISTSNETRINTSESAILPAIYNDRIVYYNASYEKPDIYIYNLSTHKETKITTSETENSTSNDYGSLAIYGNRIVWIDWPNEELHPHIYMYDLSNSNGTQIYTSGGLITYLTIYNNKIVWSYDNTADGISSSGIYMCTIPGENNGSDVELLSGEPSELSRDDVPREENRSHAEPQSGKEKNKILPGFEIVFGFFCLFVVFLYRRS